MQIEISIPAWSMLFIDPRVVANQKVNTCAIQYMFVDSQIRACVNYKMEKDFTHFNTCLFAFCPFVE